MTSNGKESVKRWYISKYIWKTESGWKSDLAAGRRLYLKHLKKPYQWRSTNLPYKGPEIGEVRVRTEKCRNEAKGQN